MDSNGGGTGRSEPVASESCGKLSGAGVVLEEGKEDKCCPLPWVAGLVLRSLCDPVPSVKLEIRRFEFELALRALLLSCILLSSRSCMHGNAEMK